jgi:hypothetical protein
MGDASIPTSKSLSIAAVALLLAGCAPPPGYCTALVEAYEECQSDAECWGNRRQWATVSYTSDLNRCYYRVSRGKP